MNVPINHAGSQVSEPVRTPENPLEYEWLTVDQAVAFCAERGLSRTPKTLRKWAERSYNKEDADIIVRREDTMWSYRWKIEKASLARKVDQELSLSGANTPEPVRTSSSEKPDQISDASANGSEPVRTGTNATVPTEPEFAQLDKHEPSANTPELVRTGSLDVRPVSGSVDVLDEVRKRLEDKDAEIAFLREQLDKAQAEVERRATSTDEALKTIDRVVRSFEMQSETNRALALSGVATPPNETPQAAQFSQEGENAPGEPDVVSVVEPTHSYQQPEPEQRRV